LVGQAAPEQARGREAPQFFLEAQIGRDYPPPITHPEHFYGFVGVALAWQFVFLLIGRDPARYRPLMPIAVLEKLAFGVPAVVLYAQRQGFEDSRFEDSRFASSD
jgi:hypothetical protein